MQSLKDFLVKIKDHLRFYSTKEKTSFSDSYTYLPKVLEQAEILAKDETLFIEVDEVDDFIFFIRKNRDPENKEVYIEKMLNRPRFPRNTTELFTSFQIFRSFNIETEECDCSCYWKLGYCKHLLAVRIKNGKYLISFLKCFKGLSMIRH